MENILLSEIYNSLIKGESRKNTQIKWLSILQNMFSAPEHFILSNIVSQFYKLIKKGLIKTLFNRVPFRLCIICSTPFIPFCSLIKFREDIINYKKKTKFAKAFETKINTPFIINELWFKTKALIHHNSRNFLKKATHFVIQGLRINMVVPAIGSTPGLSIMSLLICSVEI